MKKNNIPSIAIGVARKGKILWLEALGYADIQKRTKTTINSIYPIGSTSKSIAATGLMSLIGQGKIGLDDPINKAIEPIQLRDIDGKIPEIKVW